MSHFDKQLAIGRYYERVASQWLQESRGSKILPVYDYTGSDGEKAPNLRSLVESESLVVPDLLVCTDGKTSWVEIKYKTHAIEFRLAKELRTGLSLRLWNDYKAVQDASGLPVEIIFIHKKEGEIRGGLWDNLREFRQIDTSDTMCKGGMVFFPYLQIPLLATLPKLSQAGAA